MKDLYLTSVSYKIYPLIVHVLPGHVYNLLFSCALTVVAHNRDRSISVEELSTFIWKQAKQRLEDLMPQSQFVQVQCFVEESCAVEGLKNGKHTGHVWWYVVLGHLADQ